MRREYCKCAVGGTFSLFHEGHKHLLKHALKLARHLVVGVTTLEYLERNPKKHPVETYEIRALHVLTFCLKNSSQGSVIEIFPLDDAYGPTLHDPEIECIVVSEETFVTAVKINVERKKRGLRPLDILAVEMIPSPRRDNALSSSELWSLE